MLETLLNSSIVKPPLLPEPNPPIPDDLTDWDAIRARYSHDQMLTFTNTTLAVNTGYMAVYNNKLYYCDSTNIKVFDIMNNFATVGVIAYKSTKPGFGLYGSQFAWGNYLYFGCDSTAGGIWVVNVLTGDVTNIATLQKAGAIIVIGDKVYLPSSIAVYTRVWDKNTKAWTTSNYNGDNPVDRIIGANAMAYSDTSFIIGAGGTISSTNTNSAGPGDDYSTLWEFDYIENKMTRKPLSTPMTAAHHNPVMTYNGYFYQFLMNTSGNVSRKFNIEDGTSESIPHHISNFHSVFTGKKGVLIMKSYYNKDIQMIIVD